MTIVGGICPRCGQFHDLFLAVDGSIVCRNADGTAERIRQLEAERDAARSEVAALQVLAQDANEAFASGRREVLADLRAKVEATRDADRPYLGGYGLGWVDACDAVLALFDEAQPTQRTLRVELEDEDANISE